MADLALIKNNVRKMVEQGAPEADIDSYIASEGVTLDDVKFFGREGERSSAMGDVAQSAGAGLRNAAEGFLGQAGDLPAIGGSVGSWLAAKLGLSEGGKDVLSGAGQTLGSAVSPVGGATPASLRYLGGSSGGPPTSADINEVTSEFLGPTYEPQTELGEVVKTGAEFIPSLLSPGGKVKKAATWLGATAGAEGADRLAEKYAPSLQPYAKMVGGVFGGSIPSLVGGVKTASKEMTRLIKLMQKDGMSPTSIRAALANLGPDSTLMDIGPNFRQEGQRIVAKGGEGRATITNMLNERDAGANARINRDIEANFGPAPIPSRIEAQIDQGQEALGPAYEALLRNGRRVDTGRIANQLEGDIVNLRGPAQQHARRMREMLNITGTDQLDPDPRTLHEIRKAIDGILRTEADENAIRVLARTRAEVDRELAQAVPGIKDVDAQFAELGRQRTALGRGQQTLDSGRTAPRPTELAEEFTQGALPQGNQVGPSAVPVRLRQGNRAEIDRMIGTTANDRVALRTAVGGEGDWNRDRLSTLHGQEPTDRVISALNREVAFDNTSNRVTKNSATAERLPEEGLGGLGFRDAALVGGAVAGAPGAGIAVAGKGIDAILDRVRKRASDARDTNMAKFLTQTDRNEIATALMKANGGRPLSAKAIEAAISSMLILPGATSSLRQPVQQ